MELEDKKIILFKIHKRRYKEYVVFTDFGINHIAS